MGFVSLVGAGCGGPELITLKGLECIRRADCILYDRLASPALLGEAKPGCELLYEGKAAGAHTLPQEEMNRLLVEKARQYPYVVRLKGGDVFVFGRGGEEAACLREAGIPFEVVPGISSAVGGLAMAGIPVTHRGVARGFRVMTASDKSGGLSHLDFGSMAHTDETLVFLMGLNRLEELAGALLGAGKPADTPAALVENAARPGQRVLTAPLGQLCESARAARFQSPALIAVGPVVALHQVLDFWQSGPLAGRRLLIAQTGQGATALARRLEDLGARVTALPVSELVPRAGALDGVDLSAFTWLLFASKNVVRFFFDELARRGLDARALGGVKLAAIGAETAALLKEKGLLADLTPPRFDSDTLFETLAPRLGPGDRILFPRMEGGPKALPDKLRARCPVEEIALYRNLPCPPEALPAAFEKADSEGVLFTCASGARLLLAALGGAGALAGRRLFSIGPKTSAQLAALGAEAPEEASPYDYGGLVESVLAFYAPHTPK